MSNPYKKADSVKKKPPVKTETTPEIVEVPEVEATTNSKDNLLEGLIEQKQEGKSYGFYLSNEAIKKLDKLAKQNKCSKSKALDTLLRSLL